MGGRLRERKGEPAWLRLRVAWLEHRKKDQAEPEVKSRKDPQGRVMSLAKEVLLGFAA